MGKQSEKNENIEIPLVSIILWQVQFGSQKFILWPRVSQILVVLGMIFASEFGRWDQFSVAGVPPTCLENRKKRKKKSKEKMKSIKREEVSLLTCFYFSCLCFQAQCWFSCLPSVSLYCSCNVRHFHMSCSTCPLRVPQPESHSVIGIPSDLQALNPTSGGEKGLLFCQWHSPGTVEKEGI